MQRYTTSIYKNILDDQFIFKLIALGFEIIDIKKYTLKVILPANWLHIKFKKDRECIVDNLGRIRLILNCKNKKSKLLTRFTYKIEDIDSNNEELNQLKCEIYDSSLLIKEIIVNNKDYKEYVNSKGGTREQLLNWIEQQCLFILNSNFPEWKNELAYWNNNDN
jgi:hypothetical protein